MTMDINTLNVLRHAVRELNIEHSPMWIAKGSTGYQDKPREGFDPVGCRMCYPHDSSWPCTSAMIANDLRAIVVDHEAGYDYEALADEAERTEYDVETLKRLPDRRVR